MQMSDYISRQAAIEAIKGHISFVNADMEGYNMARRQMMELIELLPAADVRENVRGEWIRRDSRYVGWISFDCSVCGETLELDRETSNDFKYCPFCGAEMREVNYELETRTID